MELRFESARSAVPARGPVLDAIHGYKYDGKMWFEEFLAELLIERAMDWCQDESCTTNHNCDRYRQPDRLHSRMRRFVFIFFTYTSCNYSGCGHADTDCKRINNCEH